MTLAPAPPVEPHADHGPDEHPARPRPFRRLVRYGRHHLWPLVGLYATLATLAVLTNAPGRYVLDNRFEQYWNPGRRLARYLTIWDGSRGLGRAREEYWPGASIPIAAYRWMGAQPWLAEHLWHATLLTVAGVGMVAVLRLYRPRLGLAHLLAGLLYMFGPYSATFLIPSNLYYHYALAPWLVVPSWRGVQSARPWRWAAIFALLIWTVGNLDTPGLMYSAVPVTLSLVFVVFVERRVTFRHAVAWLARAGLLSVLVSLPALFKMYAGAGALAQRLESTETPQAIASASSWSESFRGLGLWLSYFRDSAGLNRPQGVAYFSNPAVVVATLVVPLVAVAAVWRLRDRARLLFGGLLATGTLLMVGIYPATSPSPYGRALLLVLDTVPSLAALRATYKAGAGYALGVSALFGLSVAAIHAHVGRSERGRRSRIVRTAPVGLAGLVILLAAWPFWHGQLYDPVKQLDEIPAYWTDAIAWLDAQPGDTRAFFAPGTTRSPYRWGWPGDDFHDALLDRPHVLDIAITLSNPLATDIIAALDDSLSDDHYLPGTFAPIARRLGVEYLVIRNDLRWDITASPRPASYSRLRADPDLTLVATFGEPGENTTDPADGSGPAADERALAPVEIFQVADPAPIARAGPHAPWLLVSGSGDAWIPLADEGRLDGGNPIVYTATRSPEELAEAIDGGAGVVVTDTNRRPRALAVQTYNADLSATIAADQELERAAEDLFLVDGSQSVAWYADASVVEATGLFRPLEGFRPQFRASMAFDGDPTTGWIASRFPDPTTRTLRIEFREPQPIDEVEIDQLPQGNTERGQAAVSRLIDRAYLRFSGGEEIPISLLTGQGRASFEPITTTSVEIDIDTTTGPGTVGIAEVRFPGVDLDTVEHLQVPDDLFRAADEDDQLAEALTDAPLHYLFDRAFSADLVPEETQLRRRFRTPERTFEVRGILSSSESGALAGAGCVDVGLAVDGEPLPVRLESIPPDPRTPLRQRATAVGCEPLGLDAGWHRLASTGDVTADRIILASGTLPEGGGGDDPTLQRTGGGLSEQRYQVEAPDGGLFVSGQSYAPVWRATLDGEDLGDPVPADAQNAWVLPPGTEGALRTWTPAQRRFDLVVTLATVAVLGCLWLAVRPVRGDP